MSTTDTIDTSTSPQPNSSRLANFDFISIDALEKAKQDSLQLESVHDPNVLYQTCLDILRQASLEAEIPRLVVFGQQSMGKTTLLDMIMGGPIGYSSTTTGTKCPVIIYLKPLEKVNPLGDPKKMGDDIQCRLNGKSLPIKDLPKAMKNLMTSTKTICFNQIILEMAVPNGVHAVFVDLPGIKIDSKDESDLTRDVVKEYVRNNPNDLYILVKKASDDPANWSYELKEFILGDRDKGGLGLTRRQTMVVGTRSVEFIRGEMNDIRTYRELRERVTQRTVKDSANQHLPLYLLELFSLSFEEKEKMSFEQQKQSMQRQIMSGRNECLELLRTKFISDDSMKGGGAKPDPSATYSALARNFDYEVFRVDLNDNFQELLKEQLKKLMKDIDCHLNTLGERVRILEQEKAQQDTLNVCSIIERFISDLVENTKFMMEGIFSVHLCARGGKNFLSDYGGNLEDNLREGDATAKSRFRDEYKEDFFERLQREGEIALQKKRARELNDKKYLKEKEAREAALRAEENKTQSRIAIKPYPGRIGLRRVGQIVRTGDSGLYGFIKEDNVRPDNIAQQQPQQHPQQPHPQQQQHYNHYATPSQPSQHQQLPASTGYSNPGMEEQRARIGYYYFIPNTDREIIEDKVVLESLFRIAVPLVYHWTPTTPLPHKGLLAWRVIRRPDGWKGFEAVLIKNIREFKTDTNPWAADPPNQSCNVDIDGIPAKIVNGLATVVRVVIEDSKAHLTLRKRPTSSADDYDVTAGPPLIGASPGMESTYYDPVKYRLVNKEELQVALLDLFVDASPDLQHADDDMANGGSNNLSMWQQIGGIYADQRLVHQMTITSIIKWFKFHMTHLEPTERFSQGEMLQLLRTVQNVVDKSDTTPLIADLLRENIHHCVIPLTRLTICAAQAAYRRILKAGLIERRLAILNEGSVASSPMKFLVQNPDFMNEMEKCVDEYSRAKGVKCSEEIEILTEMQTQVIQFDQLLEVFESCRQFEADFLSTQHLCGIVPAVKEGLAQRKQALSYNDVFAHTTDESSPDENPFLKLVLDELRIHFWVAKMVLMSSLSSKIFIDFTSGLKDTFNRTVSHQNGRVNDMAGKNLSTVLKERLMMKLNSNEMLTEEELVSKFRFDIDKSSVPNRLNGANRAFEFLSICKRAVDKLYSAIESGQTVDFLRRLEFDMSSTRKSQRNNQNNINQSEIYQPPDGTNFGWSDFNGKV